MTGCAASLQPGAVPRRRADHSAGLRAPAEPLSAAPAGAIAKADLPAHHGWSPDSTVFETRRDVVHGKPDPMHRFRHAAIERRRNSICGGRAPALGASIARKRDLTSGNPDAVMAQSDRSASMGVKRRPAASKPGASSVREHFTFPPSLPASAKPGRWTCPVS